MLFRSAYLPKKSQVFFNIPQLNISYVIETGLTHVWNYESVVSVKTIVRGEQEINVPYVKAQRNLPFSWIITNNNDVYMVSGTTKQEWEDKTVPGGSPVIYVYRPPLPRIVVYTENNPRDIYRDITSGMILKLQRGGGLDQIGRAHV